MKEGQLQLLDLLNSVLGRARKSRKSKNSAAQPLLSSSIKTRATLVHVLAACDSSLQKYIWRHYLVLTVLNITQVLDITFLDITKTKSSSST